MGGDLVYRCAATRSDIQIDAYPIHAGLAKDIRAGEWDLAIGSTGVITGAGKMVPRKATLEIACLKRSAADVLIQAFEADAVAKTPGKLVAYGQWEQRIICTSVELDKADEGLVALKASLLLPDGFWCRRRLYHINQNDQESFSNSQIDLPLDLPFDLGSGVYQAGIVTAKMAYPGRIGITFYGACAYPYARVTQKMGQRDVSTKYGVSDSCQVNERIVIDPYGRYAVGASVYKVSSYGAKTNLFNARMRGVEADIFATVSAGDITITLPRGLNADITLWEETAVLPWT